MNAIGEVDPDQIGIDLGVVISAGLRWRRQRATGRRGADQPTARSEREVIVDYSAHPGRGHVGEEVFDLGGDSRLIWSRPRSGWCVFASSSANPVRGGGSAAPAR